MEPNFYHILLLTSCFTIFAFTKSLGEKPERYTGIFVLNTNAINAETDASARSIGPPSEPGNVSAFLFTKSLGGFMKKLTTRGRNELVSLAIKLGDELNNLRALTRKPYRVETEDFKEHFECFCKIICIHRQAQLLVKKYGGA